MRQRAGANQNIQKYSTGPGPLLPMRGPIHSAQQQMLPAVQSISLKLYKSSSDVSVRVSGQASVEGTWNKRCLRGACRGYTLRKSIGLLLLAGRKLKLRRHSDQFGQ